MLLNGLGGDIITILIKALYTIVGVYFALVLHEIAHGHVALWNGDTTAKEAGRLTMNPLKHFDLVGLIMMLTVGFGYAKPVPVNSYNFKHRRRGMFTVAIAGICTNLILSFFSTLIYGLMCLGYENTVGAGSLAFYYIGGFFWYFSQLNLAFAVFNLLPIFPLDGFRIIESFTRYDNKFCRFMRNNGRYILWGLVGLSFIVSVATNYAPNIPWLQYIDVLGLYIDYAAFGIQWVFSAFWGLMIPGVGLI